MIKIKDLIQEDIYGRQATVFHRTKISDLINKVYTDGFKTGEGDMYGKGFYSTYNLESQLNNTMREAYGDVVVKFQVTIDNFLIFDYKEFIKAPLGRTLDYTEDDFILKQLDHFKLDYDKEEVTRDIKNYKTRSAEIAYRCTQKIKNLTKYVDGIIFTGSRDGGVLLCYRPNELIIPMSFTINDGGIWTKTEHNLDYFKKVFTNRNTDNSKLSKYGIKELRDGLTLETIEAKYKWVLNVDITDAILSEDQKGLVWKDGTWENGNWEGGTWEDGTWNRGKWKGGTWKNGTWKNGIWDDILNEGNWEDGTWETGTWYKGTWERGKWKNGVWVGGTWKDGTWWNGEWWKGTWENGVWKRGIWKSGIWNGGTWKDKKFIEPNKR